MPLHTTTSQTLLMNLKDTRDTAAWSVLSSRYRPMIVAFARKLGLSSDAAQDAAQETLLAFLQAFRADRFDHNKGRLRSFLFGIAHRKVIDYRRRQGREILVADKTGATAFMAAVPSAEEMERVWEDEWTNAVLQACLQEIAAQVKPKTLEAFRLYVLEEWPVEKVATHLDMKENAIYAAKNRVMSRIRELQPRMEEAW